MRLIISLLVLFCLSQNSWAQKELHTKSKKAIELYNQAYELDSVGNIFQSLTLLEEALEKDESFDEAHLLLFIIYMKRNDLNKAIQTIEISRPLVEPGYTNRMTLELATFHWSSGRYEEALKLKQSINGDIIGVDQATRDLVYQSIDLSSKGKRITEKIDFQELPNPINLFEAQYFPSLAADGTIVFTGRVKSRNGFNENLYISRSDRNKWVKPESLSESINTERYNEGTASIAADGFSIVFTGCNRPEGLGSCDLYISYNRDGQWIEPENLGKEVNSEYWESQPSLSQDGRRLYFVSRRPGGFGGQDLWVSEKNGENWTAAKNLGPTLNTKWDDCSPFIYPDGQTFYYASKGKPGFGGYDLFKTQIVDEKWEEPVNLGFPINTFDNQVGYSLGVDGWAYYSDNNLMQQIKLYRFKMPESLMPETKIILLSGSVEDADTKLKLSAELYVTDLEKDSTVVQTYSKNNGVFGFITPASSNDLMLYANKSGYKLYKNRLSSMTKKESKFVIAMEKLALGEKVVLNNILFELNSSVLNLKAKKELEVALNFLNDNPEVNIEIGGHTDVSGEADYNFKLSDDRAKAVLDFFVEYGISRARLTHIGYGESRPITIETGNEANAINRRIELVVTGI
jgi:outer membrane protein OmpA-like peptidoglycan-associated protein